MRESALGRGQHVPLHRAPRGRPPTPARDAPPAHRPAARGLRALVVDDNATNRAILASCLVARGARGDAAAGGAEALAAACARPRATASRSSVVVLDGQMPGMDGLELARGDPARRRACAASRLVMLTSTGDRREAARGAGIEHYLTKPVRRARLLATVADVLAGGEACARAAARGARARADAAPAAPRGCTPRARRRGQRGQPARDRGPARQARVASTSRATAARRSRCSPSAPTTVVFMDCQMPELDGYEATAAIRAGRRARTRHHADHRDDRATRWPATASAASRRGWTTTSSKPLRPRSSTRRSSAGSASPRGGAGSASRPPEPWRSTRCVDAARVRTFRDDYPDIADRLVDLFAEATPPILDDLRDAVAGRRRGARPPRRPQAQGLLPEHRRDVHGDALPGARGRHLERPGPPATSSTRPSRRPSRRSAPCSADASLTGPDERHPGEGRVDRGRRTSNATAAARRVEP